MTEDNEVAGRDWRIPRSHAETVALFGPGTPVRHLNPALSDWRGKVAPTPRSRRHIDGAGEVVTVRIVWHEPATLPPGAGFYGADSIEPDPGSVTS